MASPLVPDVVAVTGSSAALPASATPHIARGFASLAAGRFAALALSFVAVTLLARALGPQSMGVLQFGLAVFFYLGFLSDLGLTTTGVREFAARGSPPRLVGEILGARLALTGVPVLLAGLAYLLVPVERDGLLIGVVLTAGLVASSLNLSWVLQAREQFRALSAVEIGAALAQVVGAALLVTGRTDVVLAALAVVMGSWTTVVLSWILVGRNRAVPNLSARIPAMVVRAMPLGIAAIAVAVYYTIDTVLLGLMRTSTEVGHYAVAYRLVLPVLTVAVVAGNIALPVMSRIVSTDPERIPALLSFLSRGLLSLALPIAAGTSIAAGPLISTIFGAAYEPGAVPLAILIWSSVTVFANAPFGFLMVARGQDREYMHATLAGAALNVGANILLIPTFGMVGAAVATLLAEAIVLALILWATRDLCARPLAAAMAAALPATVVMAIAILPWRDSLAAVPIGVATYAAAWLLTRTVTRGAPPTFFSRVRSSSSSEPPSR